MRVLGCDIGTSGTKVVMFEDGEYVCGAHGPTEARPDKALDRVLDMICRNARLETVTQNEIVVTGWGEPKLSRPHRSVPQINCMRKAALWAEPSCRSVLNLGAQQSIAMSLNRKGRLLEYKMSDKCASGAGRFLEIIVEALGCTLEEIEALARSADKQLAISSQCAVFAESEVVSLINDSESVANILEAILESLNRNITGLCKRIRLREKIVIGGGLARNKRLVELIDESVSGTRVFEPEPSYMVAVGAALHAK
jgi:(R)-2-hydroxyacyl-CoA dehydratese activating ATPase